MTKIILRCNSFCISCPEFGRVLHVEEFSNKELRDVYYCPYCNRLILCKQGMGFRTDTRTKQMIPICTSCQRESYKVILRYKDGKNGQPFDEKDLLIIRIPTSDDQFIIAKVIQGSFFKTLADVLLYVLFTLGENFYSIVRYEMETKNYQEIFREAISTAKVEIVPVPRPRSYP